MILKSILSGLMSVGLVTGPNFVNTSAVSSAAPPLVPSILIPDGDDEKAQNSTNYLAFVPGTYYSKTNEFFIVVTEQYVVPTKTIRPPNEYDGEVVIPLLYSIPKNTKLRFEGFDWFFDYEGYEHPFFYWEMEFIAVNYTYDVEELIFQSSFASGVHGTTTAFFEWGYDIEEIKIVTSAYHYEDNDLPYSFSLMYDSIMDTSIKPNANITYGFVPSILYDFDRIYQSGYDTAYNLLSSISWGNLYNAKITLFESLASSDVGTSDYLTEKYWVEGKGFDLDLIYDTLLKNSSSDRDLICNITLSDSVDDLGVYSYSINSILSNQATTNPIDLWSLLDEKKEEINTQKIIPLFSFYPWSGSTVISASVKPTSISIYLRCYGNNSSLGYLSNTSANIANIVNANSTYNYNQGYSAGYESGKNNGYSSGYNEGSKSSFTKSGFQTLISYIFTYPITFFQSFLNFEFMGINLFGLFSFIITIGLVIFVLKIFK